MSGTYDPGKTKRIALTPSPAPAPSVTRPTRRGWRLLILSGLGAAAVAGAWLFLRPAETELIRSDENFRRNVVGETPLTPEERAAAEAHRAQKDPSAPRAEPSSKLNYRTKNVATEFVKPAGADPRDQVTHRPDQINDARSMRVVAPGGPPPGWVPPKE
jgi:hypothetical protein